MLAWRLTLALAPGAGLLSLAPPLLLALNANFRYWVIGGLETHLYALLLTTVALTLASGWPALTPRRMGAVAVLLALAALTRPEGMGLFVGIAAGLTGWMVLTWRREARGRLTHTLLALWGPCLLILGAHFLWRLAYYHAPLPNTYYAKTGGSWWQWHRGLGYFWHYLLDYDTLLLPLLLLAAMPLWRARTWLVAAVAALQAAAVVYVGGDGLIHYRFIVPLLPLAYVLMAVSLCAGRDWLVTRLGQRPGRSRVWWRVTPLAIASLMAVLVARSDGALFLQNLIKLPSWARHGELVAFGGPDIDPIAAGARYLGGHLPEGSVVAVNLIGRFGYYTELTILDRLGLCNRHIARVAVPDMGHHLAGHEKRDPAYVFARRPEAIVMGSQMVLDHPCPVARPDSVKADWDAINLLPGDKEMMALPGFWEAYRPAIIAVGDRLYLHLFLRRDVALPGFPAAADAPGSGS